MKLNNGSMKVHRQDSDKEERAEGREPKKGLKKIKKGVDREKMA